MRHSRNGSALSFLRQKILKRQVFNEAFATNIYGNSLLKYTEGGGKTSQYSYLVVILSNLVPDNWVIFLERKELGPQQLGGVRMNPSFF